MEGHGNEVRLRETQAYWCDRNAWSALPFLPEKVCANAAALVGEEQLYNIGGLGTSASAFHINIGLPITKWRGVKVKGADFR